MTDQPNNDGHAVLRPPPGYAWQNGELTCVTPTDGHAHHVEGEDPFTAGLRGMVNENRLAVEIDQPGDPARPLDPPGGPVAVYRTAYLAKARDLGLDERGSMPPTREQLSECITAGLAAADAAARPTVVFGHHDHTEPTGAAMIYDRAGRLDLKWVDRAAHVTAAPEVIEGFVDQVNTLRAEVATGQARFRRLATESREAIEERDRLAAWSDELAHRVPESYEGDDGTQEACIDRWVSDLVKVSDEFANLVGDDGEFDIVVNTLEGVLPLAEATLNITVLTRLRELSAKVRGE